ncbi:YbdD/YjiX family protein [Paenibacillus xerothermodurans]|uniref:Selenoprotein n=1 Tax=Paenibacillus xerothermodurans TaxID=1977292 RepID=A0A2W1NE49_PAEXE|nr:CstA-like transporter-associated (seleno)protein [Paenibacillus xerothermodurans]PZE22797.1 putative selenoprotein [Paenibacillus xerothermodurans]
MAAIAGFARRAKATIKVIFSIPDYDKYLRHQKEHHPNDTPMTEKEFYEWSLKERYESGKVNRCC